VIPLDCASDIGGTVIDFEQPGNFVNDILVPFGMLSDSNPFVTQLVFWVTGNACAPIALRAGPSPIIINTISQPWLKIGMSVVGTLLGVDQQITLTIFDSRGQELGAVTKAFQPGDTQDEYNAAALFLGFESSVPIHSFQITSTNPNFAWDEIRFISDNPVSVDRESWGRIKARYQ
jgi:hypothetical protein